MHDVPVATLDLKLHHQAARGFSDAQDFLIHRKARNRFSSKTESSVYVATQELLREEPKLTQFAFHRLLAWLDDGADSRGETYIEMRRRLVAYFDRRNRPFADDLADETFNRISRTIEQSGQIEIKPPARYCYVVARFVLLEDVRRSRRFVPVDESRDALPFGPRPFNAVADTVESLQEERLGCLDRCLDQLKPDQRELAIEYYRDAKRERIDRRRALAERLRISMNALGVRACRIRNALETCVDACCKSR